MIIAVPTGIKIWATARVRMELFLQNSPFVKNSTVECTKDYNTYSETVRNRRQKPVLRRIMRSTVVKHIHMLMAKIDLTVNGYNRMRVNSQNSSYFGPDSSDIWKQHLQISLGDFKVKIYLQDNSNTEALLIAFRTGDKRFSYFIKLSVIRAIGEVLFKNYIVENSVNLLKDGRGFVVPNIIFGKGPKYQGNVFKTFARSYSTKSVKNKLVSVEKQPIEISKGYEIIAKHWFTCFNNPNRIFSDLKGILKLESV
jgi:hypothetical protein